VSSRTISRYIERGELEAKPQGEGVNRAWLVFVDSLHELRFSWPADGDGSTEDREDGASDAAAVTFADVLRDMAARLGRRRPRPPSAAPARVDRLGAEHGRTGGAKTTRGERASQGEAADGAGQGALGAAVRGVLFETASTTVLSARSVAAEGGRDAS
jgi:hypothetical protein